MRIIAGRLGGRKLQVPAHASFRPTTDRVRESLFNILQKHVDWEGLLVCDLFAGSGSLGIEALSRGARNVTFVEKNHRYAALLERNIDTLGVKQDASIILIDAATFLRNCTMHFGLVFADPPYDYENYTRLLRGIRHALSPDSGVAVLEHRNGSSIRLPEGLYRIDSRSYGSTSLTLLRRSMEDQK